jgi:hypothetical protein
MHPPPALERRTRPNGTAHALQEAHAPLVEIQRVRSRGERDVGQQPRREPDIGLRVEAVLREPGGQHGFGERAGRGVSHWWLRWASAFGLVARR